MAKEKARIEAERKEREFKEKMLKKKEEEMALYKKRFENIPFKYSVRIKPVLSGLSENSNGDGAKRNTVFHCYVEESFVDGRIRSSLSRLR